MATYTITCTARTRDGDPIAEGTITAREPLTATDMELIIADFRSSLTEKTGMAAEDIIITTDTPAGAGTVGDPTMN